MRLYRAMLAALLGACATSEPIDPSALDGDSDDDGGTSSSVSSSTSSGSGGNAVGGSGSGGDGAGPTCGDGVADPGEECDDQNAQVGDGCALCVIECGPAEAKHPSTGHCYQVFVASVTQPSAEASCLVWGGAPGLGHLASIVDLAENDFIAPLVTGDTWIGADDLGGAWAWLDETPFAFVNWQTGEPNFPGVEHCMFMDATAKWHDHNCADLRSAYVCERRGAGTF